MTASRRKRDDDSTLHSNVSQGSDATLAYEISSTSQAGDSRRRSKRRRTLMDQLQQIQIQDEIPEQIVEHADMEDDNNSQTLTSSDDDDDENDSMPSWAPMSDAEKAQKAFVRELVFGKQRSLPLPANPVDLKVEALVRESLQKVAKGEVPLGGQASSDDMTIDTSYARSNIDFMGEIGGVNRRPRSNSLPSDWVDPDSGNMDMT